MNFQKALLTLTFLIGISINTHAQVNVIDFELDGDGPVSNPFVSVGHPEVTFSFEPANDPNRPTGKFFLSGDFRNNPYCGYLYPPGDYTSCLAFVQDGLGAVIITFDRPVDLLSFNFGMDESRNWEVDGIVYNRAVLEAFRNGQSLGKSGVIADGIQTATQTISFSGIAFDQARFYWGDENLNQRPPVGYKDFPKSLDNIIYSFIAPEVECFGFLSPMDNYPVIAKKNRAFPLKMTLLDSEGIELSNFDFSAPPVVQVIFTSDSGGEPLDVSSEVLSAGQGTDGNQFVYTEDFLWQFNLKSSNYSAAGEYIITAISGDESEYTINPSCITSFQIR